MDNNNRQFEIPYNFDKNLVDIIYALNGQNHVHCFYVPPWHREYESTYRGATSWGGLSRMSYSEYISHIEHINKLFPGSIQILLQRQDKIMPIDSVKRYINMGINKFCVGTIEQAKMIKGIDPSIEIIGSITMKVEKEDLQNEEYKKYFDGFVLFYSFNKNINKIKELPKDFFYIIIPNSLCYLGCDGTHHWNISWQQKFTNNFYCPIKALKPRWEDTAMTRPQDLPLFDEYIKIYKLQDRGWPTKDIIDFYCLYTMDFFDAFKQPPSPEYYLEHTINDKSTK